MKTFPKSTEQIQDIVAALLVEGTGVTLAYNDGAGTLTISSSVDLTGYATTAYVDDEVSANGVSLQAFASNASNLTTGTVSDARLSSNVPLKNAANTFTAAQSFGSTGQTSINTSGQLAVGGTQTTFGPAGSGRSYINTSAGLALGSGLPIAWSSNVDAGLAAIDVSARRNATGPTFETRAAGGLKVCNADGSALAPIECASGSKSAPGIRMGGASNTGLYSSAIGSTPGLGLSIGGVAFLETRDAGSGLLIHPAWSYCWGSSQADSSVDTRLTRSSAGVIDVGTTSDNALGSLNLANLTASGVAKFTGYPTSLLPAAASNAGSITYDTTISKHVGCNGSSWNALW